MPRRPGNVSSVSDLWGIFDDAQVGVTRPTCVWCRHGSASRVLVEHGHGRREGVVMVE